MNSVKRETDACRRHSNKLHVHNIRIQILIKTSWIRILRSVFAIVFLQVRINIFIMYILICIQIRIINLESYTNEIPLSYSLMCIVWINILYSITCATEQYFLNTLCRLTVLSEHCMPPNSAFWTLCVT